MVNFRETINNPRLINLILVLTFLLATLSGCFILACWFCCSKKRHVIQGDIQEDEVILISS